MKKIKPFIIAFVILGIIVAVLYGVFSYKQSKKTVQVVSMENQGMDEYWGDSIQSYGNVTSDKSQSAYIAKGTEIVAVNVKEGDHVNEGDVLLTVRKDSQDINGKTLQLQKAYQELKAEQIKLERLENTTPIPEYMHQQQVYRDKEYVSERIYVAAEEMEIGKITYEANDYVARYIYSTTGEKVGSIVYPNGIKDDETSYKEVKDEAEKTEIESYIEANGDKFTVKPKTETTSWLASTLYLDGETKQIVGEDTYDDQGRIIHAGKPDGLTPSKLKEEIADKQATVKHLDLEYRKLENELEVMKNTSDSGEIIAKVSGTVAKVQDMNNYNNSQPFVTVSATDEYFIKGAIGEFYLNSVKVGDTVSITSWDNGASAEAVISEISDIPSTESNFYSGGGNNNSSNYEFKATFDRSSGIELGSAVDISITPEGEGEGGFYIPSHFIRKDASGSYVMKMSKSNVLKKEYITVGKNLWGSMTEIKKGVTKKDYLAFPYGNGAIEGIRCEKVEDLDYGDGGLG